MSVNSVAAVGSNSASQVSWPAQSATSGTSDVLSSVASSLDMSTTDLLAQLKQGASLDDIAKSKGVSHDQLVQTIESALSKSSSGTTSTSSTPASLAQLANAIATKKGGGHHRHRAASATASTTVPPVTPSSAGSASTPGITGSDVDTYL